MEEGMWYWRMYAEYFGKYGSFIKQSIRMKPIRFGYKLWCANLPLGYLFDFDVYQGKSGRKNDNVMNFGLGCGVVLDLIDRIPRLEDGSHMPLLLAVDNYFNSFALIQQCSLRSIPIIGTLKADRIQDAPMKLPIAVSIKLKHAWCRGRITA